MHNAKSVGPNRAGPFVPSIQCTVYYIRGPLPPGGGAAARHRVGMQNSPAGLLITDNHNRVSDSRVPRTYTHMFVLHGPCSSTHLRRATDSSVGGG